MIGVQGDYGWSNADGTHASAREIGVFYHSEIESLATVTAASATPSIASSATSKAGLPGSATPTRLRRSSSGLRIRQATRGRDGRLAAVANMPSTSLYPALSSSIISTSARPTRASIPASWRCAQPSSTLRRQPASCAPVSICVSAARQPSNRRLTEQRRRISGNCHRHVSSARHRSGAWQRPLAASCGSGSSPRRSRAPLGER